jgi:hypothetical protein
MATDVKKEIKSFRQKLAKILNEEGQAVFASIGNQHVPSSTLKDSALAKSFKVDVTGKSFTFSINDYYTYVEAGRAARLGAMPMRPLIQWLSEKNIRFRDKKGRFITFRATASIINKSWEKIKKKKTKKYIIEPRPFIDTIVENSIEVAIKEINVVLVDRALENVFIQELEKI